MTTEVIYLNGKYTDRENAKISIFDRGLLMADAVYEVTAVLSGQLIDNEEHLSRLQRSLKALGIPLPLPIKEIESIQLNLIKRNNLLNGKIYLQISRGIGERSFIIDSQMKPSIFLFVIPMDLIKEQSGRPLKILSQPDIRWQRRDIKTTQLLTQSLAKSRAITQGFDDAWFVDQEGFVTEGSANNAWIVKNNVLYTRKPSAQILNGITRQTFIRLLAEDQLEFKEQAFTIEEAQHADEAFVTSAGMWAKPVGLIDDKIIANGEIGVITHRLQKAYIDFANNITAQ